MLHPGQHVASASGRYAATPDLPRPRTNGYYRPRPVIPHRLPPKMSRVTISIAPCDPSTSLVSEVRRITNFGVLDVRDRLSVGKPVFDQELFCNRTEDAFAKARALLSALERGGCPASTRRPTGNGCVSAACSPPASGTRSGPHRRPGYATGWSGARPRPQCLAQAAAQAAHHAYRELVLGWCPQDEDCAERVFQPHASLLELFQGLRRYANLSIGAYLLAIRRGQQWQFAYSWPGHPGEA